MSDTAPSETPTKAPSQGPTTVVWARLDNDTKTKLTALAQQHGMTLSQYMRVVLSTAVSQGWALQPQPIQPN